MKGRSASHRSTLTLCNNICNIRALDIYGIIYHPTYQFVLVSWGRELVKITPFPFQWAALLAMCGAHCCAHCCARASPCWLSKINYPVMSKVSFSVAPNLSDPPIPHTSKPIIYMETSSDEQTDLEITCGAMSQLTGEWNDKISCLTTN